MVQILQGQRRAETRCRVGPKGTHLSGQVRKEEAARRTEEREPEEAALCQAGDGWGGGQTVQ